MSFKVILIRNVLFKLHFHNQMFIAIVTLAVSYLRQKLHILLCCVFMLLNAITCLQTRLRQQEATIQYLSNTLNQQQVSVRPVICVHLDHCPVPRGWMQKGFYLHHYSIALRTLFALTLVLSWASIIDQCVCVQGILFPMSCVQMFPCFYSVYRLQ